MDYRTKDTRREGSSQARRGEPGGQMAVVSRPLERTPFRTRVG